MNNNTIELINFIHLVYADGLLTEKEARAVRAKAEALGISQEEAEVILEQIVADPVAVKNMVQQLQTSKGGVANTAKSDKKRVSQEINLSLHRDNILVKEMKNFKTLETLSYDEIYLRTLKKIFKSANGEKVKQLKEIEQEINSLKKEIKLGTDITRGLEQTKTERDGVYKKWTRLLTGFVLVWTYFSLIGFQTDWVSIAVGIGFSILFAAIIHVNSMGYVNNYIHKEINFLNTKTGNLSKNITEVEANVKRLSKIKNAVELSLTEQKIFQDLTKSKNKPLEITPFYEDGCNDIIRQTEISDGDMQKIMTNCLYLKDAVNKRVDQLTNDLNLQSISGLPSTSSFRSIELKVAEINVYMNLLNGYCYSIQDLSERTNFEHFMSENLINISKKDKIKLGGMKKMINHLSHMNNNLTLLSKEMKSFKKALEELEDTVTYLESDMVDVSYKVDEVEGEMDDLQRDFTR